MEAQFNELPDTQENRSIYYITEYIEGKLCRVFKVKNPSYAESKWYISTVSISAFRNRQNKIHYERYYTKQKVMPVRYCIQDAFDFHRFNELLKISLSYIGKIPESVPIIEAGNIFDFYKLIGYDHRKKRFTIQM